MSLDQEKNFQEILTIINSFSQSVKLKSLNEICHEFTLMKLLFEIEPLIDKDSRQIIMNNDKIFTVRYSNLQSILNSIFDYFDKNKNLLYQKACQFNQLINIKNIIYEDTGQIEILGELVLTISSISSKRDKYLDILSDLGDEYLTSYLNKIEKYISIDNDNYSSTNKTLDLREKSTIKQIEVLDDSKIKYNVVYIESLETEIERIYAELIKIKDINIQLEDKYRDLLKDIEILSNKNDKSFSKNDYYEESISLIDLKNRLQKKNEEFEQIIYKNDSLLRKYIEEKELLTENNKFLLNKIDYLETTLTQEQNLKQKLKEFEEIGEKHKNFDCLLVELELKNEQITILFNDKKKYENSINKLFKDLFLEREKYRSLEFEKKKLEYELKDLNGLNIRLQNQNYKKSLKIDKFNNEYKRNSEADQRLSLFNLNTEENDTKNIDKLELLRLCQEQSEKIGQLITENDDISGKLENTKQKLEINTKERDDLTEEIKDLRDEKNNILENLYFQQEKLSSESEKFSLILKEKLLLIKEIETFKRQNSNQLNYINQIEMENKKNSEINKSLQLQIEKENLDKFTIKFNRISTKTILDSTEFLSINTPIKSLPESLIKNEYNSDIVKLRNDLLMISKEKYEIQISTNEEIQSLKNQLLTLNQSYRDKENEYNCLNDQMSILKQEYTSLYLNYENLSEKFNFEVTRIQEELKIYTNSLETLQSAVEIEHHFIYKSISQMSKLFEELKQKINEE